MGKLNCGLLHTVDISSFLDESRTSSTNDAIRTDGPQYRGQTGKEESNLARTTFRRKGQAELNQGRTQ